jgi:hypothetical protein
MNEGAGPLPARAIGAFPVPSCSPGATACDILNQNVYGRPR